MTRRTALAAILLALALGFIVGTRTAAAPRAARVIPAVVIVGTINEPDRGQPEASLDPDVAQDPAVGGTEERRFLTPEVAGATPAVGANGGAPSSPALTGTASWYCGHGSPCTAGYPAGSMVAAAGPALRAALGPSWRGRAVTVAAGGRSVVVTLVDACQCHGTRLVDLYTAVWDALGLDLRRGLATVEVRWRA